MDFKFYPCNKDNNIAVLCELRERQFIYLFSVHNQAVTAKMFREGMKIEAKHVKK